MKRYCVMRHFCAYAAVLLTLLCPKAIGSPAEEIPQYVVIVSWGGKADAEWAGEIQVEDGKIDEATPWMKPYGRVPQRGERFVFDDEGDTSRLKGNIVSWRTRTRPGVSDGVVLHISGNGHTRVLVRAQMAGELSATLGELAEIQPTGIYVADDARGRWKDKPKNGALNVAMVYQRPYMPARITRLKQLYPQTTVVSNAAAKAIICAPDNEEYKRLAKEIANHLKTETGAALQIVSDSDIVGNDLQWKGDHRSSANIIAVGNINCSRLIARLYGMRLCFVDGAWPGPGGKFVVRTIHDPFGTGRNVILLGGSDSEGVAAAVAWLKKHAVGKEIVLDPIVYVGGIGSAGWESMSETEFTRRLNRRNIRYTAEAGLQMYTHTHGELIAKRFEQLARACMDVCLEKPHDYHVSLRTGALLSVWECIEEDPAFSDELRMEMTNFFLKMCRQMFELRPRGLERLVRDGHADCIHAQNHITVSALALYIGARYFSHGYDLPETKLWFRISKAFFDGLSTTHQIAENAATYGWINPSIAWEYALMSGDLTYAKRGIARTHADLAAITTNNLGFITGYGDAPDYTYNRGPFVALSRAAWFYRDREYTWLLRHLFPERGKGVYGLPGVTAGPGWTPLGGFAICYPSWEGRRPSRFTGVTVAPLYPAPVDWYQGGIDAKVQSSAPLPKVFDKISFREDYTPESQYLLLTGRRGGGHFHQDMNSIVNLTDEGRLWIVDSSYSQRAPKDHSIMALWRDGVAAWTKNSAELELRAELGRFAATRTMLTVGAKDQRIQWRRNILWRKGDYFLIIDDASLPAKGEYLGRCYFRTLGEPTLSGNHFKVEQKGKTYHIIGDDDARMHYNSESNLEVPRRARQFYPHSDPVFTTLSSSKTVQTAGGGHLIHKHLLYVASSENAESYGVAQVTPRAVQTTHGAETSFAGIGDDKRRFDFSGLTVEAEAFVVAPDIVFLAGGRTCRLGDRVLVAADDPVSVELNFASGSGVIEAEEAARLQLAVRVAGSDDEGNLSVPKGRSELTFNGGVREAARNRTFLESLNRKVIELARKRADESPSGVLKHGLSEKWRIDLGSPIRHIVTAHFGTGGPSFIIATARELAVLNRNGREKSRRSFTAPITALAVGDLDGDLGDEYVVGFKDRTVQAFGADGKPLWKFGPMPEATVANAYGRISPNVANNIIIADINGDGKNEVATTAGRLRVLDGNGRQLWEDSDENVRNYDLLKTLAVGVAEFARIPVVSDVMNDKKMEIFTGTRYTYSGVFGYSASGDGKRVAPLRNEASAMVIGKFRSDGSRLLACGDVGGTVYLFDAKGTQKGRFEAGDRVRALCNVDLDGDGIDELMVGSDSQYVFALDGYCRKKWQRNLDSPIVTIIGGQVNGKESVAHVATMHNGLAVIAKGGSVIASFPYPEQSQATTLCVRDLNDDGRDEVAVGLDSGWVIAFELEPQ